MKILFLTENFPPEVNAAATRVFERARYWIKEGHEVTVITSVPNFPKGKVFSGYKNKWYQEEVIEGIRVVRVKTYISSNEGFVLRTLDFISFMMSAIFFGIFSKRHDVVMSTSPQFFTAIAGWVLSVIHWRPFVFELGDLWPESIKGVGLLGNSCLYKALEWIELFLYRKSAAVVALTNSFKKNLIARGVDKDKIQVVINAADQTIYSPREKDLELLDKYNLKDKFVLGYIGTHGMAHGLIDLLKTAQLLQIANPNIHFLFVGDGAEKENMLRFANNGKLSNVTFIPIQPKELIPSHWSICDVAVIHLKDDPIFEKVIPSKMFEAMAMGLPLLVVSPGGESKEIIDKTGCGLWVKSGDPTKVEKAIEEISEDLTLLQKFKKSSYKSASRYSRSTQASKVIEILNNLAVTPNKIS